MTVFNITPNVTVVCGWHKTRNGFKHTATLMRRGYEVGEVKCTYLNRTWEAYEYDSVLNKLADSTLVTEYEAAAIRAFVKARTSDSGTEALATVGAVMALGDIFGADPAGANKWKERMLLAGVPEGAITLPDDWDELPEAEKETRLNNIIKELQA